MAGGACADDAPSQVSTDADTETGTGTTTDTPPLTTTLDPDSTGATEGMTTTRGDTDTTEGVTTEPETTTDVTTTTDGGGECGNGIIEAGEECDGRDLDGEDCVTQGFPDGGALGCADDCTFDTSNCTTVEPMCGDGAINAPGEECDGADLNGQDCTTQGFDGGELGCADDCSFDISGCMDTPPPCGNGALDPGEACDGANLDGETCVTQGFPGGGTLACNDNCLGFDTSACMAGPMCGNGTAEAPEVCDGIDLAGETCVTQGFPSGGVLTCNLDCMGYDTTACIPVVGGDCCAAHAGTGCDDPTCEASVCGADAFCCDNQWDAQCAGEATADPNCAGVGGSCPVEGGGDCCAAHAGTGCDDPTCEASVCGADAFCCDNQWDAQCAGEATADPNCAGVGGTCPVVGGGDCCAAHAGTGCDDATCEASVCGADAFCCDNQWDAQCANEATADPSCAGVGGSCPGGGGGGDCCAAHAGTGCDDATCEASVCGADAFCCDNQWDAQCAGEATADPSCAGVGGTCPGGGGGGDCCAAHAGTGCDDAACEASVCGADAFCCANQWDAQCAQEASLDPNCAGVGGSCPGGGGGMCSDQNIGSATGPAVASGNTTGEDESLDAACAAGNAVDHVMQWTAPAAGMYTFDTNGSTYDTSLSLHSADCVTQLACDDDSGTGTQSLITRNMAAGEVIQINVDGFNGAVGAWVLNITAPPVCGDGAIVAPELCDGANLNGQTCVTQGFAGGGVLACQAGCNAFNTAGCIGVLACQDADIGSVLGANVAMGTTVGQDNDLDATCSTGDAPDRVLRWVAPATAGYTFNTNGSAYDTTLALYSDCTNQLQCDDDSGTGTQSLLSRNLNAGQAVLIVIDGYNGATGNYILNITSP